MLLPARDWLRLDSLSGPWVAGEHVRGDGWIQSYATMLLPSGNLKTYSKA